MRASCFSSSGQNVGSCRGRRLAFRRRIRRCSLAAVPVLDGCTTEVKMAAPSRRRWSAMTLTLALILGPDAEPAPPGRSTEAAFLTENKAAVDRMMADMDVKPSGDVDRDFAGMMIPHHQGAIE